MEKQKIQLIRGVSFLVFCFCFCIVSVNRAYSQVPDTEIFVADFLLNDAGQYTVGEFENITNRAGYDNQPHFLPNNTDILYVGIEGEAKAEIWKYNGETKTSSQITQTDSTSEYSPIIMPGGLHFSVVMVEADDSIQRLWRFPMDGGEPSMILTDVEPVGYYVWADENRVVMFVLGEPFTLQMANVKDSSRHLIAGHIGRCIQKIPNEDAISFVQKVDNEHWYIKRLDLETLDIEVIASCLPESEDYYWTNNGQILMGSQGKLYLYNPLQPNSDWNEIADLSESNCAQFYRLVLSPDNSKIALVSYQGEKP